MAKLVDALALGACGETLGGSTPLPGTIHVPPGRDAENAWRFKSSREHKYGQYEKH